MQLLSTWVVPSLSSAWVVRTLRVIQTLSSIFLKPTSTRFRSDNSLLWIWPLRTSSLLLVDRRQSVSIVPTWRVPSLAGPRTPMSSIILTSRCNFCAKKICTTEMSTTLGFCRTRLLKSGSKSMQKTKSCSSRTSPRLTSPYQSSTAQICWASLTMIAPLWMVDTRNQVTGRTLPVGGTVIKLLMSLKKTCVQLVNITKNRWLCLTFRSLNTTMTIMAMMNITMITTTTIMSQRRLKAVTECEALLALIENSANKKSWQN